jgi:hypothetical protein
MTTILARFLLLLAAISALGGCARSFEALGTRDGGTTTTDDGGPAADAPAIDGGPLGEVELTPEQAACIGLDEPACAMCHLRGGRWWLRPLGVEAPPGLTPPLRSPAECVPDLCTGTLELVDRAPFHVPGRAATVASSGDRFWVAYFHTDPTPCDGACWGVRELGARSALEEFQPAYWMEDTLGRREASMEARTSVGEALLVARSSEGGPTRWQRRPLRVEGWMAEGSWPLPLDTELADVAPGPSGSVLIATYAPDFDGDGLHEGLVVERRSIDGASVLATEAVPDVFGGTGFGVRDVRMAPGATGMRPWIAAVQTWDFPPTVQVARLGAGGETSIHASSCGVRSHHAADGIDQLAVVQDCEGSTVLQLRGGSETSAVVHEGTATVPSRVVSSGTVLVVAHVEPGAITPSVTVVRRIEPGLVLVEDTIRLPGAAELVDPAGALDIAALDDGTIAVAWSTISPDPSPDAGEIAVVRLHPCGF